MRFQGSEVNEEPETSEPKTREAPSLASYARSPAVVRSLGSGSLRSPFTSLTPPAGGRAPPVPTERGTGDRTTREGE